MPAVWLPEDTHALLAAHARRTGRKHSQIAVDAIRRYLDNQPVVSLADEASAPGEHYIPDD